jgi:hypothetical protein
MSTVFVPFCQKSCTKHMAIIAINLNLNQDVIYIRI